MAHRYRLSFESNLSRSPTSGARVIGQAVKNRGIVDFDKQISREYCTKLQVLPETHEGRYKYNPTSDFEN